MARVRIDDRLVATVDQYRATPSYSATSFTASGLTYGRHSIVVEVSTDRNPQTSGTDIIIDAFDVF